MAENIVAEESSVLVGDRTVSELSRLETERLFAAARILLEWLMTKSEDKQLAPVENLLRSNRQ
jgi:hypothetical protein